MAADLSTDPGYTHEDGYTNLARITASIGIYDFINYDGMQSVGDNRLVTVEKNGNPMLGTGKVLQGYLEMSNADLANELSKVIETQRAFQFALRMATASDEIETTVNGLR